MALIDARARFDARRENARHDNGQFGEQEHSRPELTLVEVFEEMNEFGELDDLTAPPIDTYTGTPEERAAQERTRELNGLLIRAGISRENLDEKTLGDIQNGIAREQARRQSVAEYEQRQRAGAENDVIPEPRTPAEREVRDAVTQIIEARGYTLSEYGEESRLFMENWARERQSLGLLRSATAEEVSRSAADREESDTAERRNQDARLGALTEAVWADALYEDMLRAQQTIRNYRPNNYVNLKETNSLIRGELKRFGAAKFSVRGSSYSGGASTDISWVDGPPEDEVKAAARKFAGASFDGMTDMKSYHSAPDFDAAGVPVSTHYAADFVFTRREFSEETTRDATAFLVQAFAAEGKTFDPNNRNAAHDLPQAFYARATEENGGNYLRGAFSSQHYPNELVHIASTMLANERWAARRG
ncbi:MAG: hypothetical protein L6413_05300 [Coriobacteriia bacterium]|nr:hypothetical protein [Coriobacteriia bacterium]